MRTREKVLICLVAIFSIALVPEAMNYFHERVDWKNYSTKGRRLILFGDPDKAVAYFQDEKRKVIWEEGAASPRYIGALDGLAEAFKKKEMYLSAQDQYDEALKTLEKPFLKDRTRIAQVLEAKASMLADIGKEKEAVRFRAQKEKLNTWWGWFWTCLTLAFATEALYLGVVLGRPESFEPKHLIVNQGWVYAWSVMIATVGMTRGLLMQGMAWDMAIFVGPGISLALFPFIFGMVLVYSSNFTNEQSQKLLSGSDKGAKINTSGEDVFIRW